MAVYKYSTQKGNRYLYKVCINYKQFLKRGFLTRKEAELAEAKILINPVVAEINFFDLCSFYLKQRKQELKFSTYVSCEHILNMYILSFFPNVKINKIKAPLLLNFRAKIQNLNCTVRHRNKIIRECRDIFTFANDLGYQNNCNFFLKIIRDDSLELDTINKHYITLGEFHRFLSVINNVKFQLLFTFAFISGCRISEVRAIQIKNLKDNGVYILQAANSKLGKGKYSLTTTKTPSSKRFVPLSELFYMKLISFADDQKLCTDDFLFFGRKKSEPVGESTINRYMKKYIVASNVPNFIFHDFRHSVASILSSKVSNNNDVALFLGQSNKEVTEKYYILQREETKKEMAEILYSAVTNGK